MKKYFISLILIAVTLTPYWNASAAVFNQSNIIDTGIFDNTGSMNAAMIDDFLNSKSSSCISSNNGFQSQDPIGYSPAKGFVYGANVSAGQVIFDAAQAYGLNPQVILATLQKEQSLVDGSNGCGILQYSGATGYGCPDSGGSYSYSGINLYSLHGVEVTSVGNTCVNSSVKVGFSQQIIHSTWLMKFDEQRSTGNISWGTIKPGWDNSDDPGSCYSGFMTQGSYQLCPGGPTNYFDGKATIDGISVDISNGPTAALYDYTPHFHGNNSFENIFTNWFGSPIGCPSLDAGWVYRLHNPKSSDYLYTQNLSEICQALKYNGYVLDGPSVQTINATDVDAVSVYRLSRNGLHLYTTDITEVSSAMQLFHYTYEGVQFYASSSSNGGYPIYRLSRNGTFLYTQSFNEKNLFLNSGYSDQGISYYAHSTSTTIPIYRLSRNGIHLYTSSSTEKQLAASIYGYHDEGIAFYGQSALTGDDTTNYRLARGGVFLNTTSPIEDNIAMQYGYSQQGVFIYFYPANYSSTVPVYRMCNPKNGDFLYTTNVSEKNIAVSNYGYIYQGIGFDSN